MRLLSLVLLAAAILPSAHAQKKTAQCSQCHVSEASLEPETQMGKAMQLPGSNPTLDRHPRLTFEKNGFTYTVETHAGNTRYSVTDGTQTITLPVLFTMGAEAQTWILERNGKMVESLVSYYPSVNGLDITTGYERVKPASLEAALGHPTGDEDAKACFNCHSTNAVIDHKLSTSTLQPGLTCEHCHDNTLLHAEKASHGDQSVMPKDLGGLSSDEMSTFCGQCHRTFETVVRARWKGTPNVRFQPYRLAASRCFNGNDQRISCVACHNPHDKVKRDTAFYDRKCLACHAPDLAVPKLQPAALNQAAQSTHPKACPVAKANCASCHMPRVPLPNGHLTFTDHNIRIVKPNEPFPN